MPIRPSVLVLAPHPDDEVLGCGGTIRLLADSGVPVDVLFMTRGELGVELATTPTEVEQIRLAETRTAEARASCKILGVRKVEFLNGRDSALHLQPQLAAEILGHLRTGEYSRVFCPWSQDGHGDHKATFQLLRRAILEFPARLDVWLYEVWTPLRPTTCIPIDTTMDAKIAAIHAHRSQLACLDYLAAFQGLAAYRSLMCPSSRYAEAFITGGRELLTGNETL